ncbi:MAG: leucine--tRNA ligase [Bacteroidota bacterium]
MKYDFLSIEKKWQSYWKKYHSFGIKNDSSKKKFYVLDMFPYPSGQGLHTGHALGYVASDVFARYQRSLGYNVLHPMGFDAFGLPAEQYAQEVGAHPKVTTERNIQRYREQLESLGLSFDWDRVVSTADTDYYRWTQWLFLLLYNTWYDRKERSAMPIETLIDRLAKEGNTHLEAVCASQTPTVTAKEWNKMTHEAQQKLLLSYRLAYLDESVVNWCPGLGTVLANDEVKEGFSERGGYPVIKKKMQQWSLRITAYADRLLEGLDSLDWSDALKEMQRNWIGRSEGADVIFQTEIPGVNEPIITFTTCPETLFGVAYLVLAPEHPYVQKIIDAQCNGDGQAQQRAKEVAQYTEASLNISERQRMQEVHKVSGVFTGFHAIHPITQKKLPIWVAQYVIGSYGTGAIMFVPAHDCRDKAFAQHFSLEEIKVIDGKEGETEGKEAKGTMINSDFLNGMQVKEARKHIIEELEKRHIGKRKIQYRLRDAVFSRQRYWGEPFPIYYKDDIPYPMDEQTLPLRLPDLEDYKPTADGSPPLAKAPNWTTAQGDPIEYNTMPGWAGSSWYFFRYMDPTNNNAFASKEAIEYWQEVDLYVGGAEHATGHLIYARFFTKVLNDLGYVPIEEPFRKLINQGMILATSHFVYRIKGSQQLVTYHKKEAYDTTPLRVDHSLVEKGVLNCEALKKWRPDFADATFILEEDGTYVCGQEIEKMSKSKHNAINPDDVIARYGADTFRLYMMFLGPITQSKPWDIQGIEGVARFMQKVWKLFHSGKDRRFHTTQEAPEEQAERAIHKGIKGVREGIERYAFNTAVSSLMICVNTLLELQCTSTQVLKTYVQLLAPFAPHLAEELWHQLGYTSSVMEAPMSMFDPKKIVEKEEVYPVAINGKKRAEISVPTGSSREIIEEKVQKHPLIQKWLTGKKIQKIIIVPAKMVNLVITN